MGLLGSMLAGAAERGGAAAERIGLAQTEANIREEQAKRLAEHQANLQEGMQVRAEDRGIANAERLRKTVFDETVERSPKLADLEVDKAKKLAMSKIETDYAELVKLGPEKIRQAVQQQTDTLRAMSTPEMLKDTRLQALARHIIDPAYAPLKLDDGTVVMADAHSGKTTGPLKNADGTLIMVKDDTERLAAAQSLTYANNTMRAAELHYRNAIALTKPILTDSKEEAAAKAQTKASADATWAAAQEESKTLAVSALAVLNRKMKTPATKEKGLLDTGSEEYPGGGSVKSRPPLSSFGGPK